MWMVAPGLSRCCDRPAGRGFWLARNFLVAWCKFVSGLSAGAAVFRLVVRPDRQVVHRGALGVAGVGNDRR